MPEKKWYEYFVSVEGEGTPQQHPGAGPPGDAASAIAQIASQVQVPVSPPPPAIKFEKQAAAVAAGSFATFDDIYHAAEIASPAHGYSILKVAEMLNNEHIRAMPAEVKKGSILVALDAAGVKIQEVIQDAIRRDQALDAFERVRVKSVEDLEARKTEENRKIQADLDKYVAEQKARLQGNLAEVEKQKEAFNIWRAQKQGEEQKIAECVSYFVTENPITTTAQGKGGA
ncbi:MAG: hypothetical protein HYX27_16300 [Acidobacteria bacterium]|nr:hypothetical protein [Acidobacteriota bacterium]